MELLLTILDIVWSILIWIFDVFVPVFRWVFTTRGWFAWMLCIMLAGVPGFYAYRFWSHDRLDAAVVLAIITVGIIVAKATIYLLTTSKPQQT